MKKRNGNGSHNHAAATNAMPQTLSLERRIQLFEAKLQELKIFLKK